MSEYIVFLVPLPQTSAADLDELEEPQAGADTKQKLFLVLCSTRHGRGEEMNGIYMLCRTYMNTAPPCTLAGLWLSCSCLFLAVPLRRAYTLLPLWKAGMCSVLLVQLNEVQWKQGARL